MNYKIILFDLDGTLINPKAGITKALQKALNEFGISERRETLTQFIGPPLDTSLSKYYGLTKKQAKEAVQLYREFFVPHGMFESTVYEGITELLQSLKKANKKLYIVSSKPTDEAKKIALHHNLHHYFEAIVGCKIDLSNSEKAELIGEALDYYPKETKKSFVMVGDRKYDILGTKPHSIDSIGVTYGFGTLAELKRAKPTYLAQTIHDLQSYL